ncbi:MAG: sugar porter family MFS transporter [Chlamydiia bacterium]|nr:sugar porter family MFS transporter [Chlamydiia bacterium]
MRRFFKFTGFSLFVSLIAALGGLLFGFNTSIVSGALLFLAKDFNLTTIQQEVVVSSLLIGALVGAFVGGFIADQFGRKQSLILTAVLFLMGSFLLAAAPDFDILLVGRVILGFAIGVASMAVPLYIAEMSHKDSRGGLVSLNQLLITIGILLAYGVSYYYAERQDWRDMFKFGVLPAALQCIGLFFIPETPSWLISQGKHAAAEKVLRRMFGPSSREKLEQKETKNDTPSRKHWKELLKPSVRKPLLVGIGVSVIQQVTGINTVIYYAPQIFQSAGYSTAQEALLATLIVGTVNVAMTFVALWLIDKLGRRPLMISGLIGMAASLAVLGTSFFSNGYNVGSAALGGLVIYVAFFALSLGPCAWLIISEIYPQGIRGRAMGIATFANWLCNYIVSLTFLTLLETFGAGETFWLYTLICLLGLWFVYKMVPETKGKTLGDIQKFWRK